MKPDIEKIGKYEVVSVLGKGAMGVVYKAYDPMIKRYVAIKTISGLGLEVEEKALTERFIREAQAAGRLHHPNIVGIYEYAEDAHRAYIAMELVEGESLSRRLSSQGHLSIDETGWIMGKLLDALEYAHMMGVVHRDIKPSNILLSHSDEVKVTDFGIARVESSTLTQVGAVLGTPGYMSPEQLVGGSVDLRSDIFSAGILLYELLTAERAFSGTSITSVMYKVVNTHPVPPASLHPTVPKAFDAIVAKALAKGPEDRFQTAKAFAAAIDGVLNGRPLEVGASEATAFVDETRLGGYAPTHVRVDEDSRGSGASELNTTLKAAPPVPAGRRRPYVIGGSLAALGLVAAIAWPVGFIAERFSSMLSAIGTGQDPGEAAQETADKRPSEGAEQSESLLAHLDTSTSDKAEQAKPSFEHERLKPGDAFQDCASCPRLVVVPPGSFIQGSPQDELEREASEDPPHLVRIENPLAVGQHEVTRAEFARFVEETGHESSGCWVYDEQWQNKANLSWKRPGYVQDDRHPVTCVSWNDTQAYVRWLSGKTNRRYRLLSASEWEYVARAEGQAARTWGDDPASACASANVADTSAEQRYAGWDVHGCDDGYVYTARVGSFQANEFGTYDMLGNVFEWVEDCWNGSYVGAPADGSAWIQGDCSRRVLRGGSWYSMPKYVRLAFRNRFDPDYRSASFGFRVAREVN